MTLLGGLAPAAHADLILQPTAVSTNMGSLQSAVPDNVRNQSGLSAGYTSLVTDFDNYIASNPTHNSSNFQAGKGEGGNYEPAVSPETA